MSTVPRSVVRVDWQGILEGYAAVPRGESGVRP
jgi:hypothetical protein